MPVTLWMLGVGVVHAGTAVWLSAPIDPEQTPGDQARSVEAVAPSLAYGDRDRAAIDALSSELAAVRPLLDEFDGELSIIRQLDVRLAAVEVVRASDRDLVWNVLMLQGLAVHRYFPDLGSDEASSAGVVREMGDGVYENASWCDAIAMFPDRVPGPEVLADEASRVAFQEQRARALLWPTSVLKVDGLPEGAELLINGEAVPGDTVTVIPGHHRWTVERKGSVHMRGGKVVEPGETLQEVWLAPVAELVALGPTLREARGAVMLSPAVARRLETLEAPVSVVVDGGRAVRVYRVDGDKAVPAARDSAEPESGQARLWVTGGAGWLYDGNFYVHNAGAGAPDSPSTVNVAAPMLGVAAQYPVGPVHIGAGADALLPVGTHATVPVDNETLRVRLHPHAALGWGPVSATVGFYLPWHLGVGVRAAVPVRDHWSVTGAFVQGVGLSWEREGGPPFEPEASRVGWVGMAWSWPE